MVGREFDKALIPKDPGHWNCAYCGCMSTNTVPEDAGAVDRNPALSLIVPRIVSCPEMIIRLSLNPIARYPWRAGEDEDVAAIYPLCPGRVPVLCLFNVSPPGLISLLSYGIGTSRPWLRRCSGLPA